MTKQKNKINYGIIGCGRVFPVHVEAIKKDKNSNLKAVFDVNQVVSKAAAKKYGCQSKDTLAQMLADPEIDVITIVTPHNTHKKLILEVMKSGKYCICEKPLVLNKKEGQEILNSKYYKDNVFVMFQNRLNPAMQFLDKVLKEKALGKIRLCSVTLRWWRGEDYFTDWHGSKKHVGGMLYNQAAHILDLMRKICGDVKKVSKIEVALRKNGNVDDIYVANVIFKNGIIGNVEVTTYAPNEDREVSMFIAGDKGSIKVSGLSVNNIEYIDVLDKKLLAEAKKASEKIKTGYGNSHARVIGAFSTWLLGGKRHPDLVTAKEGVLSSEFYDALYKAK